MGLRERLAHILDTPLVRNGILAVILANAVILGLQTSKAIVGTTGELLSILDGLCLAIFVVELVAKLIAQRLRFFLNGWNVFDFLIVGISLMPGTGSLSVLRALRILRVLRVVSIAPSLRRVVEGFLSAMPGMASVFLLVSIIFYIGAVMATKLYGDTFPHWFGTIGESGYSLFQIMTLESWSMGIVRPVMEVHPSAWAFFVPFILVTTFAVVNLVVGLIVNSMQEAAAEDTDAETDAYRENVVQTLKDIQARLERLEKRE